MQLNKIIDDYVVSEQITVDDIQTIKEAGFKTIFCNRPDNEEINQEERKTYTIYERVSNITPN